MKKKTYSLIERFLYPIAFLLAFAKSVKRYRKEQGAKHKYSIRNFFDVDQTTLKAKDKNDIFFILGGSCSINDLESKDWELVRTSKSLGINQWYVHPFVPDILMVEGYRAADINSEQYQIQAKNMRCYLRNNPVTLLLKDLNGSHAAWPEIIQNSLGEVYSMPKFIVPGTNNESVKKALKILKKFNFHNIYPLSSRVSVTLAMSIGLLLGYKKIVLCGFDLKDGVYFWEKDGFVPHNDIHLLPPNSGQPDKKKHSTMNRSVNEKTADQSILSFYNEILKPSEVELFVGSPKSLLSDQVPIFDWRR